MSKKFFDARLLTHLCLLFEKANIFTELFKANVRSTFGSLAALFYTQKKEEIKGFLLMVTLTSYDAQNAGKLQSKIYFFLINNIEF